MIALTEVFLAAAKKLNFVQFFFVKPPGYKVFCEPQLIHYKEVKKSALNTITFYKKDDDHKKVNFNGETLSFTFQFKNNWAINELSKIKN